jgi:hypothetical protein
MALHTALLSERQRELVPARMMYPVEPSGLLGTSKIMQYRGPDYGQVFSGETGNNVIRFSVNGVGLLDPRSLYLRWSWKNVSGQPMVHCSPGSYSPIKRVRILSGFNQQILYDQDGYNVFCAFLDDYQKSVHDLVMDGHGFFSARAARVEQSTFSTNANSPVTAAGVSMYYNQTTSAETNNDAITRGLENGSAEFLQWQFKPKFGRPQVAGGDPYTDSRWNDTEKLFSICDLPHIGMFTQGRYIPLWALGGLIIELHLDHARNWCTTVGGVTPSVTECVQISDVELFYDNIQPPAKFLETMQDVIAKGDGISLVFPAVNRHLNALRSVNAGQMLKTELLVPDHSRMAQAIFQIFRDQTKSAEWGQVYKLHNRNTAGLRSWQAKLNSTYLPQQPLTASITGSVGTRKYLQFHKELLKALGQQRQVKGSITPAQYEVQIYKTSGDNAIDYRQSKGAFAVGIDLTVSDDVITGTNLRNATVTGEMFINIEQYGQGPDPDLVSTSTDAFNETLQSIPALEVQTYIMKLSQIRITAAGPILVD